MDVLLNAKQEKKPLGIIRRFAGRKINTFKLVATVVFLLIEALNIFPILFMVSSSLKLTPKVFEYPFKLIPDPLIASHYQKLFSGGSLFIKWYLNTITLVVVTLGLRLLVVGMTAYALARLRFKGRNVLFFIFTLTLMIPADMLLVPRYMVLYMLKLTNTMWSVAFLYTFEFFLVFLVRQFYLTIPKELSEAAIIDGCSHFGVFYRIILPLSKPAMVTMGLFTFVWQWSDFTAPFIFINDLKKQMLTVGISTFATEHTIDYAMQMAGATLSIIPMIIVFMFVQRYFIAGIASTGLKN